MESFPFTIGRGLDNSIVLDDPHIDVHHATLNVDAESGYLFIEDEDSVNGIVTVTNAKVNRFRIFGGSEVTIGRTKLRFRDESDPLPPAIPLGASPSSAGEWYRKPAFLFVAALTAPVITAYGSWAASESRTAGNDALSMGLAALFLLMIWAGIWAVVSKVVIHQGRFLTHLMIASLTGFAYSLIARSELWMQFLFPAQSWWTGLTAILSLVLFVVSLSAHLANSTFLTTQGRWRVSMITGGALIAIGFLYTLVQTDEFTDVPEFAGVIKSAPLGLIPATSQEGFSNALADLRDKVDSLAVKPVGGLAADGE